MGTGDLPHFGIIASVLEEFKVTHTKYADFLSHDDPGLRCEALIAFC